MLAQTRSWRRDARLPPAAGRRSARARVLQTAAILAADALMEPPGVNWQPRSQRQPAFEPPLLGALPTQSSPARRRRNPAQAAAAVRCTLLYMAAGCPCLPCSSHGWQMGPSGARARATTGGPPTARRRILIRVAPLLAIPAWRRGNRTSQQACRSSGPTGVPHPSHKLSRMAAPTAPRCSGKGCGPQPGGLSSHTSGRMLQRGQPTHAQRCKARAACAAPRGSATGAVQRMRPLTGGRPVAHRRRAPGGGAAATPAGRAAASKGPQARIRVLARAWATEIGREVVAGSTNARHRGAACAALWQTCTSSPRPHGLGRFQSTSAFS